MRVLHLKKFFKYVAAFLILLLCIDKRSQQIVIAKEMYTAFTDFSYRVALAPSYYTSRKDTKTKKQTRVPILKLELNGIFAFWGKPALVSRRLFILDPSTFGFRRIQEGTISLLSNILRV